LYFGKFSSRSESNQLCIKDFTSEGTIEVSAIKELIETTAHFFIKLKMEQVQSTLWLEII